MVVPFWGCVQSLLNEVEDLKKQVKKFKRENKDGSDNEVSPQAKAKAKAKTKN